jgi:F-type H+-transporting ATPase subunit gamma
MANLKEVKNRINSVVNTQQITKAMKMVAASKLRKAQDMITQLRPYAAKLVALQKKVAEGIDTDLGVVGEFTLYREPKKVLLVVISSDRGLCGAFNNNIFKRTISVINKNYRDQFEKGNVQLLVIGKKARDFFKRREYPMNTDYFELLADINFDSVKNVAEVVMDGFLAGKYDKVEIIYNEFKNAATQILRNEQFLPIDPSEEVNLDEDSENTYPTDYIFEPSKEELLAEIIPNALKVQFYRAVLDSNASEQGARMVAMDQATENAGDLLKELRLTYNRTRQAAITSEILEIVAGADALEKGGD